MKKRLAALLLAALALALLAGCAKEEEKDPPFQTAPYYIQEAFSGAEEQGMLMGCCTDNQSVWYLAEAAQEGPPVLRRMPLDGTAAETLPEFPSEAGAEGASRNYVGPILGGDGKLWVWERTSGAAGTYRMLQLDPLTGQELRAVDVAASVEGMQRKLLCGMAVDQAGRIFLADQKHIDILDEQGQILKTLNKRLAGTLTGSAGGALALLPDGSVGALAIQPGDKRAVETIDPETCGWSGIKYTVHPGVNQIYSGFEPCAFYYINSDTLFGVVPGDEVPLRLLPWSSAQLDHPAAVMCFALLEEGQAVVFSEIPVTGLGGYDDSLAFTRLLPTEEPPEDGKISLVYGTIGVNYLVKEQINAFNAGNSEYRIELRDYSEGMLSWSGDKNTAVYQSALSRLYAEIAAERGPDILDETIPIEELAWQGAMEDLWPWIDSDPEIRREGLMEHVLNCLEVDGKLARVCSGFMIETAVASADVAGDRTGWTMDEMLDAFGGQMPEFYFAREDDLNLVYSMFHRFDRASTLYYLINMNLSQYVNMETGECSFEGEDFKALLELIAGTEGPEERQMDLSDPYLRDDLGLSSYDLYTGVVDPYRVFPWEGKPLLYSRRLGGARDLVIDDVLFSGREPLTDYEQRLWDAGIIYNAGPTDYSDGRDIIRTIYTSTTHDEWGDNGFYPIRNQKIPPYFDADLAADYVEGGADRKIYAAYAGFPSASGSGSSFTLYKSMGISASCEAKEAAWSFVRQLLLRDGNVTGWYVDGSPMRRTGFSINREAFEEQMQMGPEYWTDPYTGEPFRDADGNPVEFSQDGVGVGRPGEIVLMAYLFRPSEVQMDRFWKLYNATEQITGKNDGLLDIILEQVQPYFAGDKSLEETVQLIQNRASLYVSEHR